MQIRSSDGEAHVALTVLEQIRDRLPSSCFAVSVSAYGWQGSWEEVWVELADIERFTSALAELDRRRAGAAVLKGMSPDEFSLSFESLDRAGHVVTDVQLKRPVRVMDHSYDYSLSVAFEFDVTSLPALVSEFRALLVR
jgi:hypothetical protein